MLADAVLPAQVSDLLPRLRGLQDRDDLLFRESALPHQVLPTTTGGLAPFTWRQLQGAGHALSAPSRTSDGTEGRGDLAPPSTRLLPSGGKAGQGGFAALPGFVNLLTRTRTQRTAGRGCGRRRIASDGPHAVRGHRVAGGDVLRGAA